MSLINEALKKAQAEQARQQSPTPGVPGAVTPHQAASMLVPERHGRAASAPPMFLSMLGGAVVMGVIAAGAFWLLWPKAPTPAPTAPAPALAPATPPAATPIAANPAPTAPVPAARLVEPTPAPVTVPAVQPAPVPAPAPMVATPEPVRTAPPAPAPVAAPAPVPVSPPTAVAAPVVAPVVTAPPPVAPVVVTPPAPLPAAHVPTAPQPRPEIDEFLRQLQVRGVMSGGRKIILFDPTLGQSRAYSSGDLLNTRAKITIARITENEIVFKDDAGVTYTKPF